MLHIRKTRFLIVSLITFLIFLIFQVTHPNNNIERVILETTYQDSTYNKLSINDKINDYIGKIEIPSISINRPLINPNSKDNNVDKNIEIINPSDMPDKSLGNMILASHSGRGKTAYFNKLINIKINDQIYIYYNDIKYTYKVIDIYNEVKDGTISIKKNQNKTTLTLTTCNGKDKQLIVIAEQL